MTRAFLLLLFLPGLTPMAAADECEVTYGFYVFVQQCGDEGDRVLVYVPIGAGVDAMHPTYCIRYLLIEVWIRDPGAPVVDGEARLWEQCVVIGEESWYQEGPPQANFGFADGAPYAAVPCVERYPVIALAQACMDTRTTSASFFVESLLPAGVFLHDGEPCILMLVPSAQGETRGGIPVASVTVHALGWCTQAGAPGAFQTKQPVTLAMVRLDDTNGDGNGDSPSVALFP